MTDLWSPAPTNSAAPWLFDDFRTLSLAELEQRAALLDRQEHKYLVTARCFADVLRDLRGGFDVLEIDGRTVFTYETAYYDTDGLLNYRQHAQGKRRRLKIRSRRYVDSEGCFFEVKLKGRRGRTIKERTVYDRDRHGTVDCEAIEFVDRCVRRHYGRNFDDRLDNTLTMRYRRVTFVARGGNERVTADFALEFMEQDGETVRAPEDLVIVEVKSLDGKGTTDATLRARGVRPGNCSKYCIGLNLLRDDLRYNRFKPTLTGHFDWSPPPRMDELA